MLIANFISKMNNIYPIYMLCIEIIILTNIVCNKFVDLRKFKKHINLTLYIGTIAYHLEI